VVHLFRPGGAPPARHDRVALRSERRAVIRRAWQPTGPWRWRAAPAGSTRSG
jgi:hypothetical protein